jgi:hypothetical protein
VTRWSGESGFTCRHMREPATPLAHFSRRPLTNSPPLGRAIHVDIIQVRWGIRQFSSAFGYTLEANLDGLSNVLARFALTLTYRDAPRQVR